MSNPAKIDTDELLKANTELLRAWTLGDEPAIQKAINRIAEVAKVIEAQKDETE